MTKILAFAGLASNDADPHTPQINVHLKNEQFN
uniref:Uncharacterized protein n=1 Tax=uncultured myxobacterium HF0200_19H16 TaxID=723559 RepID=E7C3X8_9BACT|nr:hypothetical protein [uncultured myxobacterium HF0200_19H16]